MHRIGHIGIGIMGSGMVKNLPKHGIAVAFAVHQKRDRVSELVACGAREVQDYASLAAESDVITLSLPDSSVVEPLCYQATGSARISAADRSKSHSSCRTCYPCGIGRKPSHDLSSSVA